VSLAYGTASSISRGARELWRDIAPEPGPEERIDLEVMSLAHIDGFELRAHRYRTESPYTSRVVVREVNLSRLLAPGAEPRWVVDQLRSALRTMALILRASPPKEWRLFSRPARRLPTWSRLRTRPS
jgi:hypothetical protein